MKILPLYKWLVGSQNDFTRNFQHNQQLFDQAQVFWNKLEGSMGFVILVSFCIASLFTVVYYTIYNEKPGRHYRPSYWFRFLIYNIISTLIITCGIEYIMANPRLDGALFLEIKVSIVNAIFSSIVYLIISVIWCNWGPTNACRIFKFSKR